MQTTMIDCEMTIRCANQVSPSESDAYKVQFIPRLQINGGFFGATGAVFVPKESLAGYLFNLLDPSIDSERRKEQVNQWIHELHRDGSLSLPHMALTEQQLEEYRKASRS